MNYDHLHEYGGDTTRRWTCPLCGAELTNKVRADHLTGHD